MTPAPVTLPAPAPLPVPLPLPPLVEIICQRCGGCGLEEAVTVSGHDLTLACPECGGRGTVSVCDACGLVPDVQTDSCGCSVALMEVR